MQPSTHSQTIIRAILYGGSATLLLFDIFFLAQAAVENTFLPIIPIMAGVFITTALIFIIYAERRSRELDKQEHRRLSRVAHQLENPIQVLEDDLAYMAGQADKFPAEERMKLKRMQTKTKVLLENIRDVFLMLESQSGALQLKNATYDLCILVDEALNAVKPLASAHNVEVIKKFQFDQAIVSVDRRLLLIALIHILENSILYTLTPGLVNIVMKKSSKNVQITLQDRGIGILPTDASAILLPFARGHKAEQFDPDGIGVGLTLAKYIIQRLKGKLTWQGRHGSIGSEFTITLPLV
jgi:K+-sensing histidine kinase KdpD